MITTILTDIEGTTSSISFVKDVLFPYARGHLPAFVVTHADDPAVQHWLHEAAKEAGLVSASQQELIDLLVEWIDMRILYDALERKVMAPQARRVPR